jgi:hypothetical protein
VLDLALAADVECFLDCLHCGIGVRVNALTGVWNDCGSGCEVRVQEEDEEEESEA